MIAARGCLVFTDTNSGAIGRAPSAGGPTEVLITAGIWAVLAVDASGLYYADDGGRLCRLAP